MAAPARSAKANHAHKGGVGVGATGPAAGMRLSRRGSGMPHVAGATGTGESGLVIASVADVSVGAGDGASQSRHGGGGAKAAAVSTAQTARAAAARVAAARGL